MLSQSLRLALFPFESQHPGDAFHLLQSLFQRAKALITY